MTLERCHYFTFTQRLIGLLVKSVDLVLVLVKSVAYSWYFFF